MTEIKEIKNMIDDALDDMTVSEELKIRTIKNIHEKKTPWVKTAIIPAACAAAILIAVFSATGIPGINSNNPAKPGSDSTIINTFAQNENGSGNSESGDNTFTGAQILDSWNIGTLDEAKGYMGGTVLIPSYIPEGYKLKDILAAGPKAGDAINVTMEFESSGRVFSISQGKVEKRMDLSRSTKVDINGIEGYISGFKSDDTENPIISTDLKWYVGNMMYIIQGSITEEDAVKVAENLK